MHITHLADTARDLPTAWRSSIVGRPAGANLKVVRMDDRAYPDEVHDFDEALLVIDGCMLLESEGRIQRVEAGSLVIVPAGLPHAVAPGSHGTLVIVDR